MRGRRFQTKTCFRLWLFQPATRLSLNATTSRRPSGDQTRLFTFCPGAATSHAGWTRWTCQQITTPFADPTAIVLSSGDQRRAVILEGRSAPVAMVWEGGGNRLIFEASNSV